MDVGCSAVVGNEKADDLVSKASSAIITQEPWECLKPLGKWSKI